MDQFKQPINILAANAGIVNEATHPNIWEMDVETWERTYRVNSRGTFLCVKHFLLAAKKAQDGMGEGAELENLAIVVTGSECGKFGQAGHVEYASGKAELQYGLVPTVKNEIVRLNSKGRINAVAPGWVGTEAVGDRLDDEREMYFEAQGTVALKKIAKPEDVARTVAFLASERASGHISGQVVSVDGGMEGRIVWREEEVMEGRRERVIAQESAQKGRQQQQGKSTIPASLAPARPKQQKKIHLALSIDFDAVSGWLGTGANPANNTADYSQGYFSGHVGVPRLLKLLRRLGLADKVTWCIPGHSLETFPNQARDIVASGAEIALHGYAHEGSGQMTASQEEEVLQKCISLIEGLTGKRPRGYRAPLYQLQERTIKLLQREGFEWDSSLTHYDSTPYYLPKDPAPVEPIDFRADVSATSWMRPSPRWDEVEKSGLVEVPCNWYQEVSSVPHPPFPSSSYWSRHNGPHELTAISPASQDATPMQFYPSLPTSHGYVDARQIERMWQDRFNWLLREARDTDDADLLKVFSIVLHPDTSGMAHVIGMIERFLLWVKEHGDGVVEFGTCGDVVREWKRLVAEKEKGA